MMDGTLAIDGGPAVIPAGPPAWPIPDPAVHAALEAAYADGSWGRYEGRYGARLTAALAARHQVEHVYCCASGTVAVELALRGLQVGAEDEVVLSGYDFPGNLRAVEAVGASPVFVDIDPRTWCLDAAQLELASGPRVKAVIVSHLHGGLAALPRICRWAADQHVAVVEDACQVPGATLFGQPAGAGGDVGVLSFGGSKLLTAGRGGAVLTRRADVYQRIKVYSERGNQAYPLSELQAAVLLPQLEQLPERNRRRSQNVARLLSLCADLACLQPLQLDRGAGETSFYKLPWLLDTAEIAGHGRKEFVAAVQAEGVALDVGFRGFLHRMRRSARAAGALPHSRAAAAATVLLHHPVLLEPAETIDLVAAAIRKVALGLPARPR
jgi:perosamine synthetase